MPHRIFSRSNLHLATLPLVLILAVFAPQALYAATCHVGYAEFEEAVPHIDIETCPKAIAVSAEDGFCRLGLTPKAAIIYVFRFAAHDACLADIRRASLKDFFYKK